jgi:hypothetical protein
MPGPMDGLKLARFVRTHWRPIKIVATSGLMGSARTICHGSFFLPKPNLGAQVLETLHNLNSPPEPISTLSARLPFADHSRPFKAESSRDGRFDQGRPDRVHRRAPVGSLSFNGVSSPRNRQPFPVPPPNPSKCKAWTNGRIQLIGRPAIRRILSPGRSEAADGRF